MAWIFDSSVVPRRISYPQNAFSDGSWRTIFQMGGTYLEESGGGQGVAGVHLAIMNGVALLASNAACNLIATPSLAFTAANYDPPLGLTASYRIICVVLPSSTSPGVSFTFQLYEVGTVVGETAALRTTLGSAVGGSVTVTTPGSLSINQAASSAFSAPADGQYFLACSIDGTIASGSAAPIAAMLQVRWT